MSEIQFIIRGILVDKDQSTRKLAKKLGLSREEFVRQIYEDMAEPRPETLLYLRSLFGSRVDKLIYSDHSDNVEKP